MSLFIIRRFPMAHIRRLKQLTLVFPLSSSTKVNLCRAMHPYTTGPYTTSSQSNLNKADSTNFLTSAFSDIDANLLTTEAKCSAFIGHYTQLSPAGKTDFLCDLVKRFGFDKKSVIGSANSVAALADKDASFFGTADRLRSALSPKFKKLFVHIGRVEGGVKFLVDLRADVLVFNRKCTSESDAALYQELNSALKDLLMMWFTVGFLNLERITWNSSCDLVQKVSNYEAVHRIRTWEDIKRRVGPYRRCYIFTHNSMPREPVVVLHTALMADIASSIHSIIYNPRYKTGSGNEFPDFYAAENVSPASSPPVSPEPQCINGATSRSSSSSSFSASLIDENREDSSQVSAAVFYSITSTQKGLQGIDMGNYLIKSVVRKLQEEFPHLQQFSSLSPIPGFKDWLLSKVNQNINQTNAGEEVQISLLLPEEVSSLSPYKLACHKTVLDFFKDQIVTNEWYIDKNLTEVFRDPLMRLCADYLYIQKRRNYALNPVANFHLSNGAQLWRVNYLADTSHRGLAQSCGIMVNYRYFLDSTVNNSRNYLENHQISVSEQVLKLLP